MAKVRSIKFVPYLRAYSQSRTVNSMPHLSSFLFLSASVSVASIVSLRPVMLVVVVLELSAVSACDDLTPLPQ